MEVVKNQPVTGSYTSDLEQVAKAIISARSLVDQALAHIKKVSSTEKGLSPALLDEQQLACYETSFCVADLSATEALLNYTHQVLERDELSGWVACQFGSEALKAVAGRLLARPADYGLTMASICASFEAFDNRVSLSMASPVSRVWLRMMRISSPGLGTLVRARIAG